MTRAIAIVHHYDDAGYDEPIISRQEIVCVIQTTEETDVDFDHRTTEITLRLENITYREKYADSDPAAWILAASYIDNKVYQGYLETESVEIL